MKLKAGKRIYCLSDFIRLTFYFLFATSGKKKEDGRLKRMQDEAAGDGGGQGKGTLGLNLNLNLEGVAKKEEKQRVVAEYLMDLFNQDDLGLDERPRRGSVGLDSSSKQRQLLSLSEMGGVKTFKRNSICVPPIASSDSYLIRQKDKVSAAQKLASAREEKRTQALQLLAKEKNKKKLTSSSERNLRSRGFTDREKDKIIQHKNKKKKKEKEKQEKEEREKEKHKAKEEKEKKHRERNDNKKEDRVSVPQLRLEMLSASDGDGVPVRKPKASTQVRTSLT